MTQFHQYIARLHSTILSRQVVEVTGLEVTDRSDKTGQTSEFFCSLRFYDGSELQVVEKLITEHLALLKSRYVYHYQDAKGELIFRYDNSPHHPEIETFPHHKHVSDKVLPSRPPDLSDVLREIDNRLYPKDAER